MYSIHNSVHPAFLGYLRARILDVCQLASFNYSQEDRAKYISLKILLIYDQNQAERSALRIIRNIRKRLDEIQLTELKHLIFKIDSHIRASEEFHKNRKGRRK